MFTITRPDGLVIDIPPAVEAAGADAIDAYVAAVPVAATNVPDIGTDAAAPTPPSPEPSA